MSNLRFIILILCLLTLFGCGSGTTAPQPAGASLHRAKETAREAVNILSQQGKVIDEWSREYGQTFSPPNRAQFPANRDWLRERAEKLTALLDESSRLADAAAAKYEEASGFVSDDKVRRGMVLVASSVRKHREVNELLKAQMRLVSDEDIRDSKTFNDKFVGFMEAIKQKGKEADELRDQGTPLMGL
jgi:hypothetical protein